MKHGRSFKVEAGANASCSLRIRGTQRDAAEGMLGILFTQRMMDSPEPPKVFCDFWTLAYEAIG
jgi:hypothetical protein